MSEQSKLTEEELDRLVKFFSLLIEIDQGLKAEGIEIDDI